MSTPPGTAGIPGLDPAATPTAAPQYKRHALGLPAGSVRALLAFMVLIALWLLALFANRTPGETYALKTDKVPVAFVYLQYVMILILAHFFAAHGSTIGRHVSQHSPLGLPSGTVRFLLLAAYLGLVGWLLYNQRQFEEPPEVRGVTGLLTMPLILVSGFIVGFLITKLVKATSSGGELPFWFQDIQAWFALLACIGLTIITIVYVFMLPSIQEQSVRDSVTSTMPVVETIVAAVVGFYFGARS